MVTEKLMDLKNVLPRDKLPKIGSYFDKGNSEEIEVSGKLKNLN
jgi:hypothetical protein